MCELAKLVTLIVERAPVGVPRNVAPERVARVLDHRQAVAGGDLGDAVPVGRVADEVGEQQRAGAVGDHLLDPVDVDAVRQRLAVDEHRDPAAADDRCDVGREGERARDDLGAGREIEQLEREVERRRPRVAHDPVRLAEARRDLALHAHDPPARPQPLRPGAQHLDHRLDLALVVHAARVEDALAGRRHQAIQRPPLTSSVWPVIERARSDARNTIASAMSSGVGSRRSAVSAAICSCTASRSWSRPFRHAGEHRLGVGTGHEAGHHHVHPDAVDARPRAPASAPRW